MTSEVRTKTRPGSVYLPPFPVSFPARSSRPASARSVSSDQKFLSPREKKRKPKLLNTVVFNEELDDILDRLSRPTVCSRMKSARYRPEAPLVGMDFYKWHRMETFCEHNALIYTPKGAVRGTFKRTTKRPITVPPQQYRLPLPLSVW